MLKAICNSFIQITVQIRKIFELDIFMDANCIKLNIKGTQTIKRLISRPFHSSAKIVGVFHYTSMYFNLTTQFPEIYLGIFQFLKYTSAKETIFK